MEDRQHYEDARDDANLLLQRLDDLLMSMERGLIPIMNTTLFSIARQLAPPPRTLYGRLKENSASEVAIAKKPAGAEAKRAAVAAQPTTTSKGLSTKHNLNCQDSGVNPRKKTKVGGGNDEGKGNEKAVPRETNNAESNDANDTLKSTEREEANASASCTIIGSPSGGTLAVEHQPPPSALSLQKCYEDALHSQVGPNISREEVSPEEEPDLTAENDDTRSSPSSKKRQHSASASLNDTPPRKKARTDSGPPAQKASDVAPPPPETRQEAAPNDHGNNEDGALQASIASKMIREELQKHRDFIDDMKNQVYNSLDELKAQKWLLWYRLCCCTVVSSKKYSYRGRVRRTEERQKYDELREVFDEAEKLHGYCSGLVERAEDAVWSASQVMGGE